MRTSNGMNDKDLLQKLNNLKTIKPDDNWKKNYREVLYSQISAGSAEDSPVSNFRAVLGNLMPGKILADLIKPVWAMTLVCVLILAAGIGGVYASKNSKPGDSLYIAKIISEKAQLAITFNQSDKAKLGLEFAANRAKEITQVLEESKGQENKQNEKVEQLSKNFKNEISQVKTRLTAIKATQNNKEEEAQVFGANLGKNDKKIELSEPAKTEVAAPSQPSSAATTTKENLIEEAEKLFDEKNYSESINKLEEANKAISQTIQDGEIGQVKGVSETATSTD